MKNVIIDARGRSCPEPVLMTMQAMQSNEAFIVLVDNQVAVENITRCCTTKGFSVTVQEDGIDLKLDIKRK